MLVDALEELKRYCSIVFYTDATAHELLELRAKVYVFRVNPGEYEGVTMQALERTAGLLHEQGATVLPDFEVVRKLGTKMLLWNIRDLGCGLPDTQMYESAAEAAFGVSQAILRQESRVLKVVFGSQGEGVYVFNQVPSQDGQPQTATVQVTSAADNSSQILSLEEIPALLQQHGTAGFVDQRFMPSISTDGELRLMFVYDRPVEFVHKLPSEGGISATLKSGAQYVVQPLDAHAKLCSWFTMEQLPQICTTLGVDSLPLLWTADFIKDTDSCGDSCGSPTYKLCEINCTCVGFTKQPHIAGYIAAHIDRGCHPAATAHVPTAAPAAACEARAS